VREHRRNVERTKENREKGRESRFEEEYALEGKTTQDCHLSPQPIKRLESHPSCRGEFQE